MSISENMNRHSLGDERAALNATAERFGWAFTKKKTASFKDLPIKSNQRSEYVEAGEKNANPYYSLTIYACNDPNKKYSPIITVKVNTDLPTQDGEEFSVKNALFETPKKSWAVDYSDKPAQDALQDILNTVNAAKAENYKIYVAYQAHARSVKDISKQTEWDIHLN